MATHLTSSDAEKLKQLEGCVDKLEIRASQIEDPMQVILESVLDLRKMLDEQGQQLLGIVERLDRIEGTLGAIESRLGIDKR